MFYLQSAKLSIFNLDPNGLETDRKELFCKSVQNPDGINFGFTFEKVKFKPVGQGNLTIYNADDRTLALLMKRDPTNRFANTAQVTVEAGYQGDNQTIFSGTVFDVSTVYPQGEKITSVTVSNYSDKLIKGIISIPLSSPPTLSEAFKLIADSLGVKLDVSGLEAKDNQKFSQSPIFGTLDDVIKREAANNTGFSVEYIGDTIYLSSTVRTTQSDETSIRIDRENGMILSPVLTGENLYRVNILFNPAVKIDRKVRLRTIKDINATGESLTYIEGTIYKYRHDFQQAGSTTEIEVLPDGQTVAMGNIGIGK